MVELRGHVGAPGAVARVLWTDQAGGLLLATKLPPAPPAAEERPMTARWKTVMLGLQNEREWAVFCEKVLQQPELAADARYASNSLTTLPSTSVRRKSRPM